MYVVLLGIGIVVAGVRTHVGDVVWDDVFPSGRSCGIEIVDGCCEWRIRIDSMVFTRVIDVDVVNGEYDVVYSVLRWE